MAAITVRRFPREYYKEAVASAVQALTELRGRVARA